MHACALQVSIVAFKKGQLRVLSHAWDRNMGGRALDDVLFNYFAAEFQEKHKLDVRTNLRGAFRLRVGCEKVWPACMPALHMLPWLATFHLALLEVGRTVFFLWRSIRGCVRGDADVVSGSAI